MHIHCFSKVSFWPYICTGLVVIYYTGLVVIYYTGLVVIYYTGLVVIYYTGLVVIYYTGLVVIYYINLYSMYNVKSMSTVNISIWKIPLRKTLSVCKQFSKQLSLYSTHINPMIHYVVCAC